MCLMDSCTASLYTQFIQKTKINHIYISFFLLQDKNTLSYLSSSDFLILFNDIGALNWSVTIQTAKFNILDYSYC